ncbi:MAG TPA: hypothetical protein VKS60_19065 [Stellaceae bacterium]|nr:hypothetical protein [Stellaceae bacterium]
MGWSDAAAKAQKILGPKGTIPKPKKELVDINDHLGDIYGEYKEAHSALSDAIKKLRNASSAFRTGIKQLRGVIEKEDFDLDSRNADDKKKIDQAKAILFEWLDAQVDAAEKDDKRLDDLNQHLAGLGKYAGPTAG